MYLLFSFATTNGSFPQFLCQTSEFLVRCTTEYISAQFHVFLDLAKNYSFVDWKLIGFDSQTVFFSRNLVENKTSYFRIGYRFRYRYGLYNQALGALNP